MTFKNKYRSLMMIAGQFLVLFLFIGITVHPGTNEKKDDTALVIIDVQYFYFPGGKLPLKNPVETAQQIKKILDRFRDLKMPVIHIRHNVKSGGDIYETLIPLSGEQVITKDHANPFLNTSLYDILVNNGIKKLVITGMQTHMCVEAFTRAASDFGFECTVISDGCTTRDLSYRDRAIKAEDVHVSTLSSLEGTYAEIKDTRTFLAGIDDQD